MGQVDFAYDAVVGLPGVATSVSIFADREDMRAQMHEDAVEGGLIVHECAAMASLLGEDLRTLGDAVLIDCPVPDGATLAALCRIDSRVSRSGAHLVVSTTFGGLEDVFACLSQSAPEILVNPRRSERIVALGRLLGRGPASRTRELDSEERLALLRLTEQVSQIADRLERMGQPAERDTVRSTAMAFRFGDPQTGSARSPGAGQTGDRLVRRARAALPDPRLVRRIIQQRQARSRFFAADLFADPAWDMLLDLAAARGEGARVSVTSLCIAAAVPPTTALRWISQLTEAGLFERVEDENDRRRAFIQLTDKACDAIARYFEDLDQGATALV